MHFTSLVLTGLATFAGVAFSAPKYDNPSTLCYTTMTNKPAPYKTYWEQHYSTCTNTRTSTQTLTSTIPEPTTTVTTTTTVTASTSTLTDTLTDTSTTTASTTTTETSTTTTTTTTAAGFLPVQTTLPDSSYSGSGGPVVKRDALLDLGVNISSGSKTKKASVLGTSKKQYPKKVTCYKWKHGKCVNKVTTIKTTKTITAPGTATKTSTATSTTYPSATTTTHTTTVETTTTTLTTTTTTTETDTATGAATPNCAADNFADTASGNPIDNGSQSTGDDSSLVEAPATNALACCQAGLALPNAEIFFFDPGNNNNCIIAVDSTGTCPAQGTNQWIAITDPNATDQTTIGNLGCGEWDVTEIETS